MSPLLSLTSAAAGVRDTVAFDFGWKHRTGLNQTADPYAPPPVNTDPGLHPPEVSPSYDDKSWQNVQLPHDGLIAVAPIYPSPACPNGCSGKSYVPRHVLWYRKSFTLPASWKGSSIWLDFEGSFRNTTVWINGERAAGHICGYTPFRLRLDNITSVRYGTPTVMAVYVDPDNGDGGDRSHGSGWWYEGGGLYRHVHLVRTSKVHVEQDGLFAYSNVTFDANHRATSGSVHGQVSVVNDGTVPVHACASFNLTAPDGSLATKAQATAQSLAAEGGTAKFSVVMTVPSPMLWSSSSPHLYTVSVSVSECQSTTTTTTDIADATTTDAADNAAAVAATTTTTTATTATGAALDSVSVVHGFRHLLYSADEGFFLNNEHFKVRGFCDHNNFGVVGMAVPDRINLFRAQASRSVGGNGRRTSHNPPNPIMLDIYDRVGIVVMDENRLFDNKTEYVINMGAMVKRDRNHPSVVIWSFCNEGGCEGSHEQGGPRFQAIAQKYDGEFFFFFFKFFPIFKKNPRSVCVCVCARARNVSHVCVCVIFLSS